MGDDSMSMLASVGDEKIVCVISCEVINRLGLV